ncbi:glutamine amidotransferase [Acidisoma silvae]|uniref:Cytoplasmic protein n=1 Tax=Acidisoma silvae TaxID=2802396 RepID=A0A964E056_9PROT|nr:glutamine amidotransferase [Acidisoma silvae]MCB8876812.1 cytoplasmic protein [Acidisoma silvae]
MTKTKVLLVGESWVTSATHFKGFDQFGSVTFHLGAEPLVAALKDSPFELTYMPSHVASEGFPFDAAGLAEYKAMLLSDIGANTLLLPPAVWLQGKPMPNRLKLIRDWTAAGGGLAMIGGYFSFQGIDGRGRWRKTPVEDALPVTCLPYDDRVEVPDGFTADVTDPAHPIVKDITGPWPVLLGANEVELKPGAHVVAKLPAEEGGYPLLVTGRHGKGRTAAWTSDIGPHWVPNEFVAWEGYGKLWRNLLTWLTEAAQ